MVRGRLSTFLLPSPSSPSGAYRACASTGAEPGTPPYQLLTGALTDAWTVAGSGDGVACCQLPTLTTPTSLLDERIDLVLYDGPFEVLGIDVTGDVGAHDASAATDLPGAAGPPSSRSHRIARVQRSPRTAFVSGSR